MKSVIFRIPAGLICLAALFLSGACSPKESGESSDPVKQVSVPEADQAPAVVIPPKVGSWEEMWAGLKTLDDIIVVIPKEDQEAIREAAKQGKSVNDLPPPRIKAFDIATRNGALVAWGLYTDSALLKPGTSMLTQSPETILISAFHNPQIQAVSFNPRTAYSKEAFTYTIEKLYIARLIGYLQGDTPEPGKTEAAAVKSLEDKQFFQTIYLGLLAYDRRETEPWQNAELAKISAMHELGFKEMAISELDWFINKFGPNPKADELKKKLK